MPTAGPELAALLWRNHITAIADLRELPDPTLKENAQQYGIAYGHVPESEQKIRLRRAEQLYHTLAIGTRPAATDIPQHPLPCDPHHST